jgi:hypothetical protein
MRQVATFAPAAIRREFLGEMSNWTLTERAMHAFTLMNVIIACD